MMIFEQDGVSNVGMLEKHPILAVFLYTFLADFKKRLTQALRKIIQYYLPKIFSKINILYQAVILLHDLGQLRNKSFNSKYFFY